MYGNIKVILIGGSPMTGKTTLATNLAIRYKCNCISTDDIGEILQTENDINPMKGFDYREYYIRKSAEDLATEVLRYHCKIWRATKRLIKIHSTWSNPIIIEGWSLYPKLIKNIKNENIKCLWLIADENILKKRIIAKRSFYQGATNEVEMIFKYLQRSNWHNKKLYDEVVELKEDYIKINNNLTKKKLIDKAIDIIEKSGV